MSMPEFPEISPEITCNHALNMILASIAMEELALSHVINAEGEKLQYVLGTLKTSCGREPDVDEILAVNQSMANVLDSVSQNQMILKSKMDKALQAMSSICPGHAAPTGPVCKCSAVLKTTGKCRIWRTCSALCWDTARIHGECIRFDPCDKTTFDLCKKGRFHISFAVNVKSQSCYKHNSAVSLQMTTPHKNTNIYTVHSRVPCDGSTGTMSLSGILVEVNSTQIPAALSIKLVSPDALTVENAMLSVVEI